MSKSKVEKIFGSITEGQKVFVLARNAREARMILQDYGHDATCSIIFAADEENRTAAINHPAKAI